MLNPVIKKLLNEITRKLDLVSKSERLQRSRCLVVLPPRCLMESSLCRSFEEIETEDVWLVCEKLNIKKREFERNIEQLEKDFKSILNEYAKIERLK
jgi:hypothetical protein